MKSLREVLLPVGFVLVWSGSYVVGAIATEQVAPLTVNLWRYAAGVLVFAAVVRLRRERLPRDRGVVGLALVAGLLAFGLQFAGLYIGLAHGVPAATTALLACSAPLFIAALAAAAGWERLDPRQWMGVGIGVVGVAISLADRVAWPRHTATLGWTMVGLVGLVLGSLTQSRLSLRAKAAGIPGTNGLLLVQQLAAAALFAVLAPASGSITVPLDRTAIASMSWMVVVSAVIGPLLLMVLIGRHGAAGGTSLLFVVPAVTALMAWPVLHEPIGVGTVVGLVVAGTGLLLVRPPASTPARGAEVRPGPATAHQTATGGATMTS